MRRSYDKAIAEHYKSVAAKEGFSPTSTMADEITRATETETIIKFVGECIRHLGNRANSRPLLIDVGCGNGYTLELLADTFTEIKLLGIEMSPELRALAKTRFDNKETHNVEILSGDVRADPGSC